MEKNWKVAEEKGEKVKSLFPSFFRYLQDKTLSPFVAAGPFIHQSFSVECSLKFLKNPFSVLLPAFSQF